MRCYFYRGSHIGAVEALTAGPDEVVIEQARTLFEKRKNEFDGFEVWDGARWIYRYPPPEVMTNPKAPTTGAKEELT